MAIDWVTVVAQIGNFLVLVWLLHRFLYAPVTRAMDRREARIAERVRAAEHEQAEAQREAQAYRDRQATLEAERTQRLAEAEAAAEAARVALEEAAREEVAAKKQAWLAELQAEREAFLHDLRRRCVEHLWTLARQALADLGDAELEERIAAVLVQRLARLDPGARGRIAHAAAEGVTVRSRFELSGRAKQRITRAVHEHLGAGVEVMYTLRDDLGWGIVLEAGSQTLTWSLEGYLDGFEKAVREQLGQADALEGGEPR